jgi:hypothetical protein
MPMAYTDHPLVCSMENEIVDGVFIGDIQDSLMHGASYPLVICCLEMCAMDPNCIHSGVPTHTVHIAVVDPIGAPGDADPRRAIPHNLNTIADLLDAAVRDQRKVLVHCGAGIERSPFAVCAWLMRRNGWDYNTAFWYVQARRLPAQSRWYWFGK